MIKKKVMESETLAYQTDETLSGEKNVLAIGTSRIK